MLLTMAFKNCFLSPKLMFLKYTKILLIMICRSVTVIFYRISKNKYIFRMKASPMLAGLQILILLHVGAQIRHGGFCPLSKRCFY
jgi:hypothetical protein